MCIAHSSCIASYLFFNIFRLISTADISTQLCQCINVLLADSLILTGQPCDDHMTHDAPRALNA